MKTTANNTGGVLVVVGVRRQGATGARRSRAMRVRRPCWTMRQRLLFLACWCGILVLLPPQWCKDRGGGGLLIVVSGQEVIVEATNSTGLDESTGLAVEESTGLAVEENSGLATEESSGLTAPTDAVVVTAGDETTADPTAATEGADATTRSGSSETSAPIPDDAATATATDSSSAAAPAASGGKAHFYDSCFQALAANDAGQDGILDPTEYTKALSAYTRGVAVEPLPQDLVSVFMAVADGATMKLSLPGLAPDSGPEDVANVAKLCSAINGAIQKILGVAAPSSELCMGSLGPADTVEPTGRLSPDEYVAFLRTFSGGDPVFQGVSTIDELNLLTRTVFSDMAVDGYIDGGAGPEYMVRVVVLPIIF
jgi:hypothetical protein